MFEVQLQFKGDAVTALKVVDSIAKYPLGLLTVISRRVQGELKKRFRYLEATRPNKMGGTRSHYWARVSEKVAAPKKISKNQIQVAINDEVIAHKVGLGPNKGWIRPKDKSWLAIPAIKEAYNKSPKEWDKGGAVDRKLTFLKKNDKLAMLAEVELSLKKNPYDDQDENDPKYHSKAKKTQIIRVIFWLKKEVYQPGDITLLPDAQTWNTACQEEYNAYLELKIAQEAAKKSQTK